MVSALDAKAKKLVTTGNIEIDGKIGGGLPPSSLTLIEGQSDAGKSVLVQQFMWGSLQNGLRIALYTTHCPDCNITYRDPVPNTFSQEKSHKLYRLLLDHIDKMPQYELVIVDSLTAFVAHASESETLDFFSQAKDLCDSGRSLMLTMHSYASNEQLLTRLRSICDAHMRLRVEEVGSQLVKVLEVAKVRGANKSTGNVVSFDVEPNIGMRIIPITKAKA